ncbi:MAG: hypothetical protein HY876_02785 [Coriobacteriales bacterium]|nr:hypothetical protein [Coriobacteriales bacterium]
MGDRHSIDIRIEDEPKKMRVPWRDGPLPAGTPAPQREMERGVPRLVIDLRVRRTPQLAFMIGLTSVLFAAGIGIARLVGVDGPSLLSAAGVVALLAAAFVIFGGGLWSSTQTIEVDPHFVTVTQGGALMSFCLRSQVTEVEIIPPKPGRIAGLGRLLMDAPRIRWGTDEKQCGSAGAGFDEAAAAKVIEAMNEFLSANPAEPGFNYLEEPSKRAE